MIDPKNSVFLGIVMLHIAGTASTQIIPPVLLTHLPICYQAFGKALTADINQIKKKKVENQKIIFKFFNILPDLFSAIYKLM
jgi:hypothetical protein